MDDEIASRSSLFSNYLLPSEKNISPADAANRIRQFNQSFFTFDAIGQPLTKTDTNSTTHFEWDTRGRLTKVTLPNGQIVEYGYDAIGRRINRTANGVTTLFVYDDADVVLDRSSDGSRTDYLNGSGIDRKLRQSSVQGPLYFLQDQLSSTIALTDMIGSVVEQGQYEVFGANSNGQLMHYFYNGREKDILTGLMYYRLRWYDPQQGRFFSEDPIGIDGGLNLYSYVHNNPIDETDPFGLCPLPLDPGTNCQLFCDGKFKRFFALMPLFCKFAKELNIDPDWLITLSRLESGWLDDHNFELCNPFGVQKIENGRAVGNRQYESYEAAFNEWKDFYGVDVKDSKSFAEFVNNLLTRPKSGKAKYNSKNKKYGDFLISLLSQVQTKEEECLVPKCDWKGYK